MVSTYYKTPSSVLKLTISLLFRLLLTNRNNFLPFVDLHFWERFLEVKTSRNLGLGLLYPYPISKPFPRTPEAQYFLKMYKNGFVFFIWFCFPLYSTQDLA